MIGKVGFAILMLFGTFACAKSKMTNQAIFLFLIFCITVWMAIRESHTNREFKEFQNERRSKQ